MLRKPSYVLVMLALIGCLTMTACADMPKDPAAAAEYRATNDPLEPMNRTIFDVNDFLDRLLLRPLAELYRAMIPPPLRDRIAGITSNMREPVIFANNILQFQFDRAGTTAERFGINTTIGIGGMFDWANDWGMPQQTGDFGQTLSSWGIASGPYLVLPLLGPSNFRDAIGYGVDALMSPWQYIAAIGGNATQNRFIIAYVLADGIVRREQNIDTLDALRAGSIDFYAQMRSVYRQYRDKQLGLTPATAQPNFDDYQ